jgi:hypothetical protein
LVQFQRVRQRVFLIMPHTIMACTFRMSPRRR